MKTIEYLCYLLACAKGIFLFTLPSLWVLGILALELVILSFYAIYVGTTAKPGGGPDEQNRHQKIFRIIQKCILIFIPSLGIGAYIFGSST